MDAANGADLLAAWSGPRLLIPSGVNGLFGHGEDLERLVDFISRWIMRAGADEHAEILRFPPMLPRRHFEATGYFLNFASLAGTVHCFCGDEEEHRALSRAHDAGEDWTGSQAATDLVMLPAACYPVYPAVAARGPVRADAQVVDACSYCFRHEPSRDPTRMQMFRQHERVFIGTRTAAEEFRARWVERAATLAQLLELPHEIRVATDPFFGRIGRVMARSQREQELKLELLVPILSEASPTACASFNLHLTKMATSFGLMFPDGLPVSTACAGFGLERLALAVVRHHGKDPAHWPEALRHLSG